MGFEGLMERVLFLEPSEMCHMVCCLSAKLYGVILQKTVILTLISLFSPGVLHMQPVLSWLTELSP